MLDPEALSPGVRQMFISETRDDLQLLRRDLLLLGRHQDEPSTLRDMGRLAHKIKGSAATFEYDHLAALAHTFEDMLQVVYQARSPATERDLMLLSRGIDLLAVCLEAAAGGREPDPLLPTEATRLLNGLRVDATASVRGMYTDEETIPLAIATPGRTSRTGEPEAFLRVEARRLDDLMARTSALATNRAMLARLRQDMARFHQELDTALMRLKDAGTQVSDWQPLMHALVMPPAAGTGGDWARGQPTRPLPRPMLPDEAPADVANWPRPGSSAGSRSNAIQPTDLERFGEVDQALRTLAEALDDVTASSASLVSLLRSIGQAVEAQQALMAEMQQDVAAIRLVPFDELVPRLRLAARQLAADRRKVIQFSVRGEMTQIDRDIGEALAEPLLQLVRNGIVHGIESPEERREAGKPERGSVWLSASFDGNEVTIEVGDDGCGINPSLLVAAAIAAGMLAPDAGRTLSEDEALNLMFEQGISVIEAADVAGGHGIGLDQVRSVVERLKGSIAVTSEPGSGTVFRIRVPISLSVLKVLHISTAEGAFAVPFSSVRQTLFFDAADIRSAAAPAPAGSGNGPARVSRRVRITHEHAQLASAALTEPEAVDGAVGEVPAFALAELLGYHYLPRTPQPALLLDVGRRPIVLLIDQALDEHEVVVRALPRHLRRRGVRGATVTLDGQVLLLLDVAELVAGVLEGRRALPPPRPAPRFARAQAPRVLVVDNSVSMRNALESTLTRAGYDVQLARDGFEALGQLLESLPQAMILDLEMPRPRRLWAAQSVAELPTVCGRAHRRAYQQGRREASRPGAGARRRRLSHQAMFG